MKSLLYNFNKYIVRHIAIEGVGWFFLLLLLAACGNKEQRAGEGATPELEAEVVQLNYRLNEPEVVINLPEELEEISGLVAVDQHSLLANEDETGHLYYFNLENPNKYAKWKWGKKGDYEGVALIGNTAYILESEGNLYEVRNYSGKEPSVNVLKTGLDDGCDAEGLCQLSGTESLLITCKEGSADERVIYQYKPSRPGEAATPFLKIRLNEIENSLVETGLDKFSLNLRKMLNPKGSSGVLFPSGIAVHPFTKELYLLSAKSKLLLIYTAEGSLKEVVELTHTLFRQPEAITFTPDATLYIANEGKGGEGNILKFTYED